MLKMLSMLMLLSLLLVKESRTSAKKCRKAGGANSKVSLGTRYFIRAPR